MELIIKTPLENAIPEIIDFNHEELKKELEAKLDKYNKLVVTEDSIKDAKADRATLNKFRTAIEDRRREVKAQCLKPYEDFEAKIKEVVALIDKPIKSIDGQVKKFDDIVRDQKKDVISQYFIDKVGDLADVLTLKQIFNEKWLNVSYTMANIEKEIDKTITTVRDGLAVITEINSDFTMQIQDKFLQTLDMTEALGEKARLETLKANLEKTEAEQKAKMERLAAEKAVHSIPAPPMKPAATSSAKEAAQVHQIDFRIWATKEQLDALKAFLKDNNIKYGKVVD